MNVQANIESISGKKLFKSMCTCRNKPEAILSGFSILGIAASVANYMLYNGHD